VKGPLNTPPSPQGKPVIVQAGGSPRGIRAAAKVVDHAFAADMPLDLQVQQRRAFDDALTAIGRDPSKVGILWQTPITVGKTEAEAIARRERLLTLIPLEAVGAYLSHNCGYDFSRLPGRFSLKALNYEITATHASPVGFMHELSHIFGESAEMTPVEFFDHGRRKTSRILEGTPTRPDTRSHTIASASTLAQSWLQTSTNSSIRSYRLA
jgi:alkanesulfonate monooxygenase SsuD/methylene tetrahydromethanopterin reductase-like flavin-dependent oxidoreductase (luciferase family)